MKLSNETAVDADPGRLFDLLADVEQVAGCLPGAAIEGREGDDYIGAMKVKVGPITAVYRGTISFLDLDRSERRAVLKARASETNGNGDAEAVITTAVVESGEGSVLRMDTDLQIRGRIAQLGRGAMERISQQLFEQFARNVQGAMAGGVAPGGAPAPEAERSVAAGQSGSGSDGAAKAAAPSRPTMAAPAVGDEEGALDAFGLLLTPGVRRGALLAGAWLMGWAYGFMIGRLRRGRT